MDIIGHFIFLIKNLPCINPRSPQDQVIIGRIFWVSTSFCITSYSLAVLTLMCGGFIPKFAEQSNGFEKGLTLRIFDEENY